jgi:hypothetical protein
MPVTDCDKTQAAVNLMLQLAEGERTGREKGWLSIEEVERKLGETL